MKTPQTPDEQITVTLVFALPGVAEEMSARILEGSTLGEAIKHFDLKLENLTRKIGDKQIGIFGKIVDASYVLKANDRIEVYRPLIVDPKEARRRKVKTIKRSK
jgi:uncharacterized protein